MFLSFGLLQVSNLCYWHSLPSESKDLWASSYKLRSVLQSGEVSHCRLDTVGSAWISRPATSSRSPSGVLSWSLVGCSLQAATFAILRLVPQPVVLVPRRKVHFLQGWNLLGHFSRWITLDRCFSRHLLSSNNQPYSIQRNSWESGFHCSFCRFATFSQLPIHSNGFLE